MNGTVPKKKGKFQGLPSEKNKKFKKKKIIRLLADHRVKRKENAKEKAK